MGGFPKLGVPCWGLYHRGVPYFRKPPFRFRWFEGFNGTCDDAPGHCTVPPHWPFAKSSVAETRSKDPDLTCTGKSTRSPFRVHFPRNMFSITRSQLHCRDLGSSAAAMGRCAWWHRLRCSSPTWRFRVLNVIKHV